MKKVESLIFACLTKHHFHLHFYISKLSQDLMKDIQENSGILMLA